jgi:hypothetical protein
MKRLCLFLALCGTIVAIASCKKESGAVSYVLLDTGSYTVKSGTITVTAHDTTQIYTAPGDVITVYVRHMPNSPAFTITARRNVRDNKNYTQFYLTLVSLPAPNATVHLGSGVSQSNLLSQSKVVNGATPASSYWSTINGNLVISDYLQNGNLMSGGFSAISASNTSSSFPVSGNIDLKLNIK